MIMVCEGVSGASSNYKGYVKEYYALQEFQRTGKIPKGYHIHHKNGIKTDNCILNLQLVREYDHYLIHNFGENSWWNGKTHSNETKLKMSKSKNTTGYFRVTKLKAKKYKKGFCWAYQWTNEDGKVRRIKAKTIEDLKKRVLNRKLEWIEY